MGPASARKRFPVVVASSALLGAQRWQPTRSVCDERRVSCMKQHGITVAARLAVSRDTHVEVPTFDFVLASLRGSSGTLDRRLGIGYMHCQRHLLVSNTLCQARPAQFWSDLDLPQPYFVTDCGQARRVMLMDSKSLSQKQSALR